MFVITEFQLNNPKTLSSEEFPLELNKKIWNPDANHKIGKRQKDFTNLSFTEFLLWIHFLFSSMPLIVNTGVDFKERYLLKDFFLPNDF